MVKFRSPLLVAIGIPLFTLNIFFIFYEVPEDPYTTAGVYVNRKFGGGGKPGSDDDWAETGPFSAVEGEDISVFEFNFGGDIDGSVDEAITIIHGRSPGKNGGEGLFTSRVEELFGGDNLLETVEDDEKATEGAQDLVAAVWESQHTSEISTVSRAPLEEIKLAQYTYVVGDREDFQSSVVAALQTVGLTEARGPGFNILWGAQMGGTLAQSFLSPRIAAAVRAAENAGARPPLVGGFPGAHSLLGGREGMARLYLLCKTTHHEASAATMCDFLLPTFAIHRSNHNVYFHPGAMKLWQSAVSNADIEGGGVPWVVKSLDNGKQVAFAQAAVKTSLRNPVAKKLPLHQHLLRITFTTLGKGEIGTRDGSFSRWAKTSLPEGSAVVQRYVADPLLFKGRKVDFRVWVIVTSLNPLRIYMLDRAFPKISRMPFNPDHFEGLPSRSKKLVDCTHFYLALGEGCSQGMPSPYPTSTAAEGFLEGLVWGSGVPGEGRWQSHAWPNIIEAVTKALLVSWDELMKADEPVINGVFDSSDEEEGEEGSEARVAEEDVDGTTAEEVDVGSEEPPPRKPVLKGLHYHRFLFLSPDVAVSSNGDAYVVEMNPNGHLFGDSLKSQGLWSGQQATEELLRLLGATGYDRSEYQEIFTEQLSSFCNLKKKCKNQEHLLLWGWRMKTVLGAIGNGRFLLGRASDLLPSQTQRSLLLGAQLRPPHCRHRPPSTHC